MKYIFAFLLIFFAFPAKAQTLDLSEFRALPVLHEGRVKPIESFARHYLEIFSGRTRYDGRPAIDWLAKSLFDPASAAEDKIFLIRNPQALGLDHTTRYISYLSLSQALTRKQDAIAELMKREPDTWSADQQALMQYQDNALAYAQILRSLTLWLPLNIEIPKSLNIKTRAGMTLADLSEYAPAIEKRVRAIVKKKGDDPARYTQQEKEIVAFAFQLDLISAGGAQNGLLKIIPAGGTWVAPWSAGGDAAYRDDWKAMAQAWRSDDAATWNKAVDDARTASAEAVNTKKLHAEILYHQGHFLTLAMMLFMTGFIATGLHGIFARPVFYQAGWIVTGAALLTNIAAIALRVYILSRPPVGTLYESILFVAAIAAIGGLLFERARRDGSGLLAASLAGGILLFIAEAFAGDDTMKVLVAVLNTNFWLATHVLCITIGYGWCILTSLFAHFYLIGTATRRLSEAQQTALVQTTKSLALIALLFTTIGTILGGIWADQSWGRFWGWDPKENGALLIVLWLAWCLHGSIAAQLNRLSFMAAVAALNIIVALAWFGVNLLGTGLHSYGFIEGVAIALFSFCAAEALLIAGAWGAIHRRHE